MIRLQRVGRRNHAEFRVVVCEHTTGPKSGKNVEILGSYNPHTNTASVDEARAKYWMGVGAQVSDTVHNLFIREGILEGKKKNVLPKKTVSAKEPEAAVDTTSDGSSEAGSTEIPATEGEEKPAEAAA